MPHEENVLRWRSTSTMPLNIPGILVHFQVIFNPRLVVPGITVRGAYGE